MNTWTFFQNQIISISFESLVYKNVYICSVLNNNKNNKFFLKLQAD